MYDTPLSVEQLLTRLAEGPERIARLTEGLTPEQARSAPAPGEWSARDALAHLRACADMWGKAVEVILREDHPTFKAVNPLTWIKRTDYPKLEFQPSLRAYAAQRAALMAVLRPLQPHDWERAATVTGAGRPLERTARTYALWLANHERSHFRQFEQIAEGFLSPTPASREKQGRGPWSR